MKQIPLTQGKVALIDDDDYLRLIQHEWRAQRKGCDWYAYRWDKARGNVYMHREILGLVNSKALVNHINGNTWDNRKENLRPCTHRQRHYNQRKVMLLTSRFKGVSWHASYSKWRAVIQVEGKQKSLGYFEDEEAAARAYDEAALHYFGEFARINFPAVQTPLTADLTPPQHEPAMA